MKTEDLNHLASAVLAIAHGGTDQATGLEALGMAIAGTGRPGDRNLLDGLYRIAEAIGDQR